MVPLSPPKLDLANTPTEFRLLERASKAIGGPRIWLKSDDQTGSIVSGNKIRKLEYLMADALRYDCGRVITCGGLQSNHCRATAAVAAQLGLKCHLLLRGPAILPHSSHPYEAKELEQHFDGNLLLDQLLGADVSVYSPRYYGKHLDQLFTDLEQHYQGLGESCYSVPTGGSNGVGLWGYIAAAQELQADFAREGIAPSAVICASGSGGTQGGLTLGFHLHNSEIEVQGVAVCDSAEYFFNKICQDVNEWMQITDGSEKVAVSALNIQTIEGYIGPGYAQGYPELFQCIQWLAKTEGVVLDPVYTGKAFYGMVKEIEKGRYEGMRDLVFVHTGGIFGLFPFKQYLTPSLDGAYL